MRIRLSSLVFGLLFIPSLAHADGHKADFFSGLVFGDGGSSLTGYNLQFGVSFKQAPQVTLVVADVTQHFGGHNGKDLSQTGYQAGARFYVTPGGAKHKLYIHGLGGFVYANDGTPEAGTNPVGVFGLGYELFTTEYASLKPEQRPHIIAGLRAQVDYTARSERESYWRGSVGVVFRFMRH